MFISTNAGAVNDPRMEILAPSLVEFYICVHALYSYKYEDNV